MTDALKAIFVFYFSIRSSIESQHQNDLGNRDIRFLLFNQILDRASECFCNAVQCFCTRLIDVLASLLIHLNGTKRNARLLRNCRLRTAVSSADAFQISIFEVFFDPFICDIRKFADIGFMKRVVHALQVINISE